MTTSPSVERLTPLDLLIPRTYINAVPWLSGFVFPTAATLEESPSLEIRWHPDSPTVTLFDKGTIGVSYETLSAKRMPPEDTPSEVWPVPRFIDDELFAAGAPVFGASYFRFADEQAIGVCVCAHHSAVDATGLADIVRLWSQQVAETTRLCASQGVGRFDRLLDALSPDLEAVSSQSFETTLKSHPEYSTSTPIFPAEFHPCEYKIFSIPLARVNSLKEDLGRYMTDVPTTNTIACALIWSAITRARSERCPALVHKTSRLAVAVNGRQRLRADFSSPTNPYLANVVLYSLTQLSVEDLTSSEPAAFVSSFAKICDGLLHSQSPAHINARSIAEVCSLVTRVEDYKTIFVGWDLFQSRDLTITSWAGLDLYEIEFGKALRKPEFVRIPGSEADGVGILLPRKRNLAATDTPDEVIEAMIMLWKDDMGALEQDHIWKSFTM
ncbi:transferase family-domain-containing protein [Annulohypoxylon bovei var. microspora]|nr:transferase family-domain-containing protein [Annulohypoxylon bovei var. microspora]